jgi:hypothetical protein
MNRYFPNSFQALDLLLMMVDRPLLILLSTPTLKAEVAHE